MDKNELATLLGNLIGLYKIGNLIGLYENAGKTEVPLWELKSIMQHCLEEDKINASIKEGVWKKN